MVPGSAHRPRPGRVCNGFCGDSARNRAGCPDIVTVRGDQHMATHLFDRTVAVRMPRSVWPANPVAALWGTMVGKKVVMAVTGMVLVGFVIAHMLGNLKIFLGPETIDAYAMFL